MSFLEIEKLSIRFGGLTAVSEVNLSVAEGQIFSIIGPNGAGKTTLFNVITGIYRPTQGQIRFLGMKLLRPFTLRTGLGMLLIGIITAIGSFISLHAETLWEEIITTNYVYLEPFPWPQALQSTRSALLRLLAESGRLELLIGFFLGVFGAFVVWRRSRVIPEVVTKRGICRTFQNIRLFQGMTVLENVLVGMDPKLRSGFFSSVLRLPLFFRDERAAREKALEVLRLVELDDRADVLASSLPYGHQRRLEIARALASSPRLLLLDEPAAGMNPSESADLVQLIRKIRDTGVTILLIEHHMRVVMNISDRIAVIDYGHKIAEGTPEEICNNPKVIAAYLGDEDVHLEGDKA